MEKRCRAREIYKADPESLIDSVTLNPFDATYRPGTQARETTTNPAAPLTIIPPDLSLDLKQHLKEQKIELINASLNKAKHNQRHAAKLLNLTYHQLRGYFRKYDLASTIKLDENQKDLNKFKNNCISASTSTHRFELQCAPRRGGRAAEGAPLLREYRLIPYRGFESLSLRHSIYFPYKSVTYEDPRVNGAVF